MMQMLTINMLHCQNLDACKEHLMESGKVLVEKAIAVRHRVAELGVQFIKDDAVSEMIFDKLSSTLCIRSKTYQNEFHLGNTYSLVFACCHATITASGSL
jgi:hypothetical protein